VVLELGTRTVMDLDDLSRGAPHERAERQERLWHCRAVQAPIRTDGAFEGALRPAIERVQVHDRIGPDPSQPRAKAGLERVATVCEQTSLGPTPEVAMRSNSPAISSAGSTLALFSTTRQMNSGSPFDPSSGAMTATWA